MTRRRAVRRSRLVIPATLLVVLLGMVSGCFYLSGSPLDGKKDFRKTANGTLGFGGFKPHKTTRSNVEAALGPPWHVSSDGSTVVYTMSLDGYGVMPLCFAAKRRPSAYAMAIRYAPDGSIDRYQIEHDAANEVGGDYMYFAEPADFWAPLFQLAQDGFDVPRPPRPTTTGPSASTARSIAGPASTDDAR